MSNTTKYVDKFVIEDEEILIKDSQAQQMVETALLKLDNLKGKKIIVLGDSLTGGFSQYGTVGKTWLDNLETKFEMDAYNYSVSGSSIASLPNNAQSSDMCVRIDSILSVHDSCDIFIVEGGANDKNKGIEIGSANATLNATFSGAIKNIIVKIRRKYGKNCKLLFMTTYHRYDTLNDIGLGEIDYVKGMMRACSLFSIPCFNNYNNSGISLAESQYSSNEPYKWADSGLDGGGNPTYHFSVKAYEFLTNVYERYIMNGYVNNINDAYYQTTDGDTIWTRERLDDGKYLVTFRKTTTVDFTKRYAPIWVSATTTITPPSGLLTSLSSLLSVNISAGSSGYTWVSITTRYLFYVVLYRS